MDIKLVKKAKRGNKKAFENLIGLVKEDGYKIAYYYLNNYHDACDVLCIGIEKAYKNIGKLKKPEGFKSWFLSIVVNEAKMHIRKESRLIYLEPSDQSFEEEAFTFENQLLSKLYIEDALKELNEEDRLYLMLKYYQGYTFKEISELTKLSENTIKSRVYRGIKRMKVFLEEGDEYARE